MRGKFEIFKDRKSGFRFRLKATNGQTILASQGYTTKASCMNGIRSVTSNAADSARFEKTESAAGFRFTMTARNRKIIGVSETYSTERARDNGIASVSRHAAKAKIDDLTTTESNVQKAITKTKAASKK